MFPPRGWVLQFSENGDIEVIVGDDRCKYFSNFEYGSTAPLNLYKYKLIPPEYT